MLLSGKPFGLICQGFLRFLTTQFSCFEEEHLPILLIPPTPIIFLEEILDPSWLSRNEMRCFLRFGTIFTILKTWKTPIEECYFTKSNTSPRVFFTFLKLYKWFQIAKSISDDSDAQLCTKKSVDIDVSKGFWIFICYINKFDGLNDFMVSYAVLNLVGKAMVEFRKRLLKTFCKHQGINENYNLSEGS